MTEIRLKIEAQVPGLQVELLQLMEDLIGDLTVSVVRTFGTTRGVN